MSDNTVPKATTSLGSAFASSMKKKAASEQSASAAGTPQKVDSHGNVPHPAEAIATPVRQLEPLYAQSPPLPPSHMMTSTMGVSPNPPPFIPVSRVDSRSNSDFANSFARLNIASRPEVEAPLPAPIPPSHVSPAPVPSAPAPIPSGPAPVSTAPPSFSSSAPVPPPSMGATTPQASTASDNSTAPLESAPPLTPIDCSSIFVPPPRDCSAFTYTMEFLRSFFQSAQLDGVPKPPVDSTLSYTLLARRMANNIYSKDLLDREQRIAAHLREKLNKLTRDNFNKLVAEIIDLDVNSRAIMNDIVTVLHKKVLDEFKFQDVYADVVLLLTEKATAWVESFLKVRYLDENTTPQAPSDPGYYFDVDGDDSWQGAFETEEAATKAGKIAGSFKSLMWSKCKTSFEGGFSRMVDHSGIDRDRELLFEAQQAGKTDEVNTIKLRLSDREAEYKVMVSNLSLNNIRFLGHMCLRPELLDLDLAHEILSVLLDSQRTKLREELISQVVAFFKVCGKVLQEIEKKLVAEDPNHVDRFQAYLDILQDVRKNPAISSKVKFSIMDLMDLIKADWVSKDSLENSQKVLSLAEAREIIKLEENTKRARVAQKGGDDRRDDRRGDRDRDDRRGDRRGDRDRRDYGGGSAGGVGSLSNPARQSSSGSSKGLGKSASNSALQQAGSAPAGSSGASTPIAGTFGAEISRNVSSGSKDGRSGYASPSAGPNSAHRAFDGLSSRGDSGPSSGMRSFGPGADSKRGNGGFGSKSDSSDRLGGRDQGRGSGNAGSGSGAFGRDAGSGGFGRDRDRDDKSRRDRDDKDKRGNRAPAAASTSSNVSSGTKGQFRPSMGVAAGQDSTPSTPSAGPPAESGAETPSPAPVQKALTEEEAASHLFSLISLYFDKTAGATLSATAPFELFRARANTGSTDYSSYPPAVGSFLTDFSEITFTGENADSAVFERNGAACIAGLWNKALKDIKSRVVLPEIVKFLLLEQKISSSAVIVGLHKLSDKYVHEVDDRPVMKEMLRALLHSVLLSSYVLADVAADSTIPQRITLIPGNSKLMSIPSLVQAIQCTAAANGGADMNGMVVLAGALADCWSSTECPEGLKKEIRAFLDCKDSTGFAFLSLFAGHAVFIKNVLSAVPQELSGAHQLNLLTFIKSCHSALDKDVTDFEATLDAAGKEFRENIHVGRALFALVALQAAYNSFDNTYTASLTSAVKAIASFCSGAKLALGTDHFNQKRVIAYWLGGVQLVLVSELNDDATKILFSEQVLGSVFSKEDIDFFVNISPTDPYYIEFRRDQVVKIIKA